MRLQRRHVARESSFRRKSCIVWTHAVLLLPPKRGVCELPKHHESIQKESMRRIESLVKID